MEQMINNKEEKEISFSDAPNPYWEKFLNRFSEIDALPVQDWKPIHILAYMCKKYENLYNEKYVFNFNTKTPSKSSEIFFIKRLGNLLSSDPKILKDYIDWFFQNKLALKKRKIVSFSSITEKNNVNDFKFNVLLIGKSSSNIERTTKIPSNYFDIIKKFGFEFTTYGEIAFLKKCVESGLGEKSYSLLLDELKNNGMDLSCLDKVK